MPDELPRGRDWVAREVPAHVDEMPYWMGEIERMMAGPIEPVPFGREPTDLIRLLTIDRDRTLPISELYARLDYSLERVVRRLLELDVAAGLPARLHKQRGEMTIRHRGRDARRPHRAALRPDGGDPGRRVAVRA